MNKVIGYCRISSSVHQDLDVQKQLILEYAQRNRIIIDEFIESEISSRLSPKLRKIDELMEKLNKGDILISAELSRMGRNMIEVLSIINAFNEKGIKIIFIRQPELSTTNPYGKLLTAIYSYFSETERTFISIRTKSGLETARSKGKLLGRPRGSKSAKGSVFEPFRNEILKHLKIGVPINSILKIINSERTEKKLTYMALCYYIEHDTELMQLK